MIMEHPSEYRKETVRMRFGLGVGIDGERALPVSLAARSHLPRGLCRSTFAGESARSNESRARTT